MIPLLPMPLPNDQDFLFHPVTQNNLTLYTHIVDYGTSKILVKNILDQPLHISRWQKLGHIIDISYDNCFLTDTKSVFQSASVPPKLQPFFNQQPSLTPSPTKYLMETRLHNGVRVYRDTDAVAQLSQLVVDCPSIWESEGFVRVLLERWMKVLLKPGWEAKVFTIKPRVYSLGNNN